MVEDRVSNQASLKLYRCAGFYVTPPPPPTPTLPRYHFCQLKKHNHCKKKNHFVPKIPILLLHLYLVRNNSTQLKYFYHLNFDIFMQNSFSILYSYSFDFQNKFYKKEDVCHLISFNFSNRFQKKEDVCHLFLWKSFLSPGWIFPGRNAA